MEIEAVILDGHHRLAQCGRELAQFDIIRRLAERGQGVEGWQLAVGNQHREGDEQRTAEHGEQGEFDEGGPEALHGAYFAMGPMTIRKLPTAGLIPWVRSPQATAPVPPDCARYWD
ncbi:hypothetical protein D3C86_1604090 [compost metagenome]